MTTVVIDIEADGLLHNVTQIYCIVCKECDSGKVHVFEGDNLREGFRVFASTVDLFIGHNIIGYDRPCIERLLGVSILRDRVFDTLIASRLLNVAREGGHSLENWGNILGFKKMEHKDFSCYSEEMLEYCKNDVELTARVYRYLRTIIDRNGPAFKRALSTEHNAQSICVDMSRNGFYFEYQSALELDGRLRERLAVLDERIQSSFAPVVKRTQLKTKVKEEIIPFNPGSPKQIVDRLWEAGWKPIEKTKTHAKAKKPTDRDRRYGWKVNEVNLSTLPASAPEGFKYLVEHIMLSARRRTLAEWFAAYEPSDHRIHGEFNALGARSHRFTHSSPNMGNIATKKTIKYNTPYLRDLAVSLGGEMRSLWSCPKGSLLVGTDMESAHLRIFAHLINDKAFIRALVEGKKEDGTDPHSVNKKILGDICVDRDRAKTFIFSFLNGAGASKVSEIFACSIEEATAALERFVQAYPGLARLKKKEFPASAKRGYFIGVDGRFVMCDSAHLMMGMTLQNYEAVIMKAANVLWYDRLQRENIPFKQVNFVHDEWVTEVQSSDRSVAEYVAKVQCDAIKKVGELFMLNIALSGESKIGTNWLEVH